MIYLANPCSNAGILDAMRADHLGFIDTPAQGNMRPEGVVWCADNGAFSNRFNEEKWWAFLEANAHAASTCLFAVAPDVVGDAAATLERSRPWLPKIRSLGYRVAFVAQDGQEALPVPWDEFDVLFIGGSTEFKLGPAAQLLTERAKWHGKWVHMGRVNSRKRLRLAESWGVDSCDGTLLTFGPDKHLRPLLRWLTDLDGIPRGA